MLHFRGTYPKRAGSPFDGDIARGIKADMEDLRGDQLGRVSWEASRFFLMKMIMLDPLRPAMLEELKTRFLCESSSFVSR